GFVTRPLAEDPCEAASRTLRPAQRASAFRHFERLRKPRPRGGVLLRRRGETLRFDSEYSPRRAVAHQAGHDRLPPEEPRERCGIALRQNATDLAPVLQDQGERPVAVPDRVDQP